MVCVYLYISVGITTLQRERAFDPQRGSHHTKFMNTLAPYIAKGHKKLLKDSPFRHYLRLDPIPVDRQTIEHVIRS